ncbi:MAG: hypothetical protein LBT20_04165 [Clostridiales bacterium]|jgi:hypothetical protein|nr:hypothetical protein [Clostridiales bacterium]
MSKKRPFILRILYYVLQWTWGILQNLIGFLYSLKYRKNRRAWYHGAYVVYVDDWLGGLSLGMFVFATEISDKTCARYLEAGVTLDEKRQSATVTHEFGHTLQSILLGPLYLIVIGIASFSWKNLKYFQKLRKEKNLKYMDLFCEKWANEWGNKWTGDEVSYH